MIYHVVKDSHQQDILVNDVKDSISIDVVTL